MSAEVKAAAEAAELLSLYGASPASPRGPSWSRSPGRVTSIEAVSAPGFIGANNANDAIA
jgi:hypothetical protein